MADAVAELAGSLGRTRLGASAWAGSTGARFAERRDFRHVSTTVQRRQHLADLQPRQIDELHEGAGAIASAYELVRFEETTAEPGHRRYRLVARHRESRELVGHTTVVVDAARPSAAVQDDTAVVPEHRGHRLGLWLKSGMLLWLRETEPQVTTVDAWNEESHQFMVAVNDMLGYRVLGRRLAYER